jgi:type IV pilus assembly protein PilE
MKREEGKPMCARERQKGFTLIELMIVVAILGILAAIVYPSYQRYVKRANRVDAQAVMLENVQFMERYFTSNTSYAGAVLPKTESGSGKYTISFLVDPTDTAFTIRAVPVGGYTDAECGTLTISHTGAKTESGTGSLSDCWKS